MSTLTKFNIEELLLLSAEDRATLAGRLIESLDEPSPEWWAAWKEELDRRWSAYERGEMETFSEEEVMAELDELCD